MSRVLRLQGISGAIDSSSRRQRGGRQWSSSISSNDPAERVERRRLVEYDQPDYPPKRAVL